jgi:hypothetical protein
MNVTIDRLEYGALLMAAGGMAFHMVGALGDLSDGLTLFWLCVCLLVAVSGCVIGVLLFVAGIMQGWKWFRASRVDGP